MAMIHLCHECGGRLEPPRPGSMLLYCPRCRKRRHAPTHPALVVVKP